jgi:ABC-2 type transport system permease protein
VTGSPSTPPVDLQAFTPIARARRLSALMKKEALQIVRDPSSILIAFVLPVVLLFLFGYGVSLDTTRTRIGVVLEVPSPTSRSLAAAFQASPYFETSIGVDRREFEDPLVRGVVGGIVVVPSTFDAEMARRGGAPQVQVLVDGTDPNTAALVDGYVQGVIGNWVGQRAVEDGRSQAVSGTEDRMWFNPELTSRYFLVPGSIAIVMALVGTLLTALVVAREWERGTMEAMMATPVSPIELLVGKVVPYFVLGLGSMTICAGLAVYLFHVPFRGSVGALYALSSAFLLPALGQGLLISAATKNQFLASQLALMTSFLPTFLLSGFLFEIASMPRPIQLVTPLVAARWLIPSLESIFLTGDLWPVLLKSIGILLLYGFILLALAARTTRKRVA